jgi:two-component system NtrC family sensor kinase
MTPMHELLRRQLEVCLGGAAPPSELAALLAAVSETYAQGERERKVIERSLQTTSEELIARNRELSDDIARRERAERERDLFFELSADLFCMGDLTGKLLLLNPAWTITLGYFQDELMAKPIPDWVEPADKPRLCALLATVGRGETDAAELRWKTRDGATRWLSFRAAPAPERRFLAVARDTTELRAHEDMMHQSQKLQAVGQLAGGIAHEINTPLQFINDNLGFVREGVGPATDVLEQYRKALASLSGAGKSVTDLQSSLAQAEELADLPFFLGRLPLALDHMDEGLTRVAQLVQAMKEFSRTDGVEMRPGDVNGALLDALAMARNELKRVAEIETTLGKLPDVPCRPGDLRQAFLSVLLNAGQAIESLGSGRGKVKLSTELNGPWVRVVVEDTGCGIPAEIRHRVFEPFFTTRPIGQGVGQGLAIARAVIVDRHQGVIDFESQPGSGTRFIIQLPTTKPSVDLERS